MDDDTTYTIWRFRFNEARSIVATGLTLDEAQAHCKDEATHGDDWFDGYEEEHAVDHLALDPEADRCPSCTHPLEWDRNEGMWFCPEDYSHG